MKVDLSTKVEIEYIYQTEKEETKNIWIYKSRN